MTLIHSIRRALLAPQRNLDDIERWREHILSVIISVVVVLGSLAAVPSIIVALIEGRKTIAVCDVIALAWLFVMWRSHRMSYRTRAGNFCLLVYLLGLALLFTVGPTSQIYLMAVPVMTALLLGVRPALFALVLNAVTLMCVGYLSNADLPLAGFEVQPLMRWAIITINFLFIDAMLTFSCAILLYGLGQSLEKSRDSEVLYRATFENAPIGVARLDIDGRWLQVNKKLSEITGYSQEEMKGLSIFDLTHPDDIAAEQIGIDALLCGESNSLNREKRYIRKDGTSISVHVHSSAVRNALGSARYVISVASDITARKAAEDQIHALAYYDDLTNLPNRRLMMDRLNQALFSSERSHRAGAIMFIDLDNFKTLNDIHGHDVGDRLLVDVAGRLQSSIRQCDTLARVGGDDFVVIIENLTPDVMAAVQVDTVAQKILGELNRPYRVELQADHNASKTIEYHCSASIGVTLFGAPGDNVEALLKQADLAVYQAKDSGRNTVCFFDTEMQAKVAARASLADDLREAIRAEQFILHFQPQVVAGGRVTGAEVLVRWRHPQRGIVSPAEFIPLAEETGLILAIGHWVLQTACRQLAAWAKQPETAELTIAVNVSAQQFTQHHFVDHVLDVLNETFADPQRLKLELTESLLVANMEEIIVKMSALKALGVAFSLDDFGTGYSSLSYLKRLPLDQLKIDQSFVRDVLSDQNDAAIARTIIALGHSLGLDVIAEGVETREQRDFLAEHGCHAFQGYFYCRPVPIDEFERFVRRTYAEQCASQSA